MRFDYSHSFISVNRVCTTVLLIFFKKLMLNAFLHLMFYYRVEIRMFTLKLQCIDFSFNVSRNWRHQLLVALFDSAIHLVFSIIDHTKDDFIYMSE